MVVIADADRRRSTSSTCSSSNIIFPEDDDDELSFDDDVSVSSVPPRDVEIQEGRVEEVYDVIGELGEGKYGTVFKCTKKETGERFAAKYINYTTKEERAQVLREVQILKKVIHHSRIVQLHDAFCNFKTKQVVVVTELIEGGELFDRVTEDHFVLTERAAVMFTRQICEAVKFVHDQNIIHLDLKPDNILCETQTGTRIKLIDFGLAQEYSADKDMRIVAGSPEFIAPEVINFEKLDFFADMWSIGVIVYILLSGLSPFLGDSVAETYGNVTRGKWNFEAEEFEKVSAPAKDFVSKLLCDKGKRMTAEQCLAHEWLKYSRTPKDSQSDQLNKERLRKYVIKRRWRKAVNAILFLRRMGCKLTKLPPLRVVTARKPQIPKPQQPQQPAPPFFVQISQSEILQRLSRRGLVVS